VKKKQVDVRGPQGCPGLEGWRLCRCWSKTKSLADLAGVAPREPGWYEDTKWGTESHWGREVSVLGSTKVKMGEKGGDTIQNTDQAKRVRLELGGWSRDLDLAQGEKKSQGEGIQYCVGGFKFCLFFTTELPDRGNTGGVRDVGNQHQRCEGRTGEKVPHSLRWKDHRGGQGAVVGRGGSKGRSGPPCG